MAASGDPNDKIGPSGFGTSNFVSDTKLLPYKIDFENDNSATAPAQFVSITDQLSPLLDWDTFRLSEIAFGDVSLTIPPDSQYFQTVYPMTYNGKTFNVLIEAGIHSDTGQVFATFQSIDPNTELPPDVLTGFLPPEDDTGRGKGHISYTIQAKAGLPTGTAIRNVALIVFDQNQGIATNQKDEHDPSLGTDPSKEALITIDSGLPASALAALPGTTYGTKIALSWNGADDVNGSGIGAYDLFVSDNGGAFTAFKTGLTTTSVNYVGVVGHTYRFYVVATDNVGNRQTDTSVQTTSVAPPNHAPVLTPSGKATFDTLLEDASTTSNRGVSVSTMISRMAPGGITDFDANAKQGIAVYSAPNSGGTWQYSLDNGGTWSTISGVSQTNALLLTADAAGNTRLRFVPLANFNGNRKISFRAWDQTSGNNGGYTDVTVAGGGTPFSLKADSATVTVTPVNDAPLLYNIYNPVVPTVNKMAINNPGFKVSAMISSIAPNEYITDADGGPEGIAVYAVQDVGGHWEYSLNNGTSGSWVSIGAVAPNNTLLLKSDALTYLRFVPNGNSVGDRKIYFRAWDQSIGVAGTRGDASVFGGTTPFSVGADSVTLTVNTVNDAPVLDPSGSPSLPTISKTNGNPAGISILALIASGGPNYISDLESTDPKGIAIYGAPSSGGTWQYSLDSGATWINVGTVDQSHSLLLKAIGSTLIRFKPLSTFTGTRQISFSAWDESTGIEGTKVDTNYDGVTTFNRGGKTAYSIARDTASITVTT